MGRCTNKVALKQFFVYLFLIAIAFVNLISITAPNLFQVQNWIGPEAGGNQKDVGICSQQERKALLEDHCANLYNPMTFLPKLYVNHHHKVAYCEIPKAACSSMKTFLSELVLEGTNRRAAEGLEIHHVSYLNSMNITKVTYNETLMRNYTKVIIVREPFSRLLSAYRDKLTTASDWKKDKYYMDLRDGIIKEYRKKFTASSSELKQYLSQENITRKRQDDQGKRTRREPSLDNNGNATIDEFFSYLLDRNPGGWDIHFKPYLSLCNPCLVKYDVIIKQETLEHDGEILAAKLKTSASFTVQNKVSASYRGTSRKAKNTVTPKDLSRYFTTTNRSVLNKLRDIHDKEFRLFGYHFDTTKNTAYCAATGTGGRSCC